MPSLPSRSSISCALATVLTACSGNPSAGSIAVPQESTRQFSQADKDAARALSLGNNSTVAKAGTPYAQAILCSAAIESVAARFRGSGSLSEQQMHLIAEAKGIYDRRSREIAKGEGMSDNDIQRDVQQAAAENSDLGDNARAALACLQRLQA